jgi:hypothetical protein
MRIAAVSWAAFSLALFPLFPLFTALPISAKPADAESRDAGTAAPERADVFAQGIADLEAIEGRVRAHPDSLGPRWDRLRVLFVLGVKEPEYLDAADKAIADLASRRDSAPETSNLARAYRGAVRVVRAKHGFRPGRKMEHLKAGLPALDSAVASAPDQAEVRYLRLVSGYYLPFFIGRKEEVRQDFAALARLLPGKAGEYPPRWYLSVAGFVLDKGRIGKERQAELRKSMQAAQAALAAETAMGAVHEPGGK